MKVLCLKPASAVSEHLTLQTHSIRWVSCNINVFTHMRNASMYVADTVLAKQINPIVELTEGAAASCAHLSPVSEERHGENTQNHIILHRDHDMT